MALLNAASIALMVTLGVISKREGDLVRDVVEIDRAAAELPPGSEGAAQQLYRQIKSTPGVVVRRHRHGRREYVVAAGVAAKKPAEADVEP